MVFNEIEGSYVDRANAFLSGLRIRSPANFVLSAIVYEESVVFTMRSLTFLSAVTIVEAILIWTHHRIGLVAGLCQFLGDLCFS